MQLVIAGVGVADPDTGSSDAVIAASGDGAETYTVVYDVTIIRDVTSAKSPVDLEDDTTGEPLETLDAPTDDATVVGLELLFDGS